MEHLLTLETISFTGFADINNNTFIDTDISYDDIGIPIIKSKRIKGLLKESCIEILELENKSETEIQNICDKLFGKKGELQGCINWDNFYIENYENIRTEIITYNQSNNETIFPYFCQSIFTETIAATSIHHENKAAKENTLRIFRLLQPNLKFLAKIDIHLCEKSDEYKYFNLAVKNLQEGGISRNRGFGDIKLSLKKSNDTTSIDKIKFDENTINDNDTIQLIYETQQPIIIPTFGSDLNYIQSADILPGNLLRGVFAKYASNPKNLDSILNSEETTFSFGFPLDSNNNINYPLPYFLHKEKDKEIYMNLFNKDNANKIISKPIGRLGSINSNGSSIDFTKFEVLKESGFHHSRDGNDERIKGKNVDGDIFYYEAIRPRQKFAFTISGNKELLKEVIQTFASNPKIHLGKSKTVQYGAAKLLEIKKITCSSISFNENQQYILTLLSPTIVLNEYGESTPDVNTLSTYIESTEIENSALSITEVEIANALWKTMPMRYRAFSAGSSFLLKNENIKDNTLFNKWLKDGIGEFTDMGFGKVAIYENLDINLSEIKIQQNTTQNNEINNLIIQKFKNKQTYDDNYLKGFNVGIKFNYDSFTNTMVTNWYNKVKKATSIECVNVEFSEKNLSPHVFKKLDEHKLGKYLKKILNIEDKNPNKDWTNEVQPQLLGLFKAIQINTKKKQ